MFQYFFVFITHQNLEREFYDEKEQEVGNFLDSLYFIDSSAATKHLISKELLEKKLRHLYKVRLRHLKVLLLLRPSPSFQTLQRSYAAKFSVVSVIFLVIEGLNAPIVLAIDFLHIIIVVG
jgi:hypothetical protein